ncbi:hypothetical protein GCM10010249_36060 [Streptomyces roseolilacinus]|uniref:Uncharacterized protein n=1 Tax=Streptomyces roseolilacinus TaxID=66904 RepID=A0A918B205_9ACTN|nr:hypothetical protein GCM10010249_36060 [Streptomyces roseolilacinus]
MRDARPGSRSGVGARVVRGGAAAGGRAGLGVLRAGAAAVPVSPRAGGGVGTGGARGGAGAGAAGGDPFVPEARLRTGRGRRGRDEEAGDGPEKRSLPVSGHGERGGSVTRPGPVPPPPSGVIRATPARGRAASPERAPPARRAVHGAAGCSYTRRAPGSGARQAYGGERARR